MLVFGAPGHVTPVWDTGAVFFTENTGVYFASPGFVPVSVIFADQK